MINTLLGKVFGTKNERVIKALMPNVQAINALEPEMQKLSDAELRAKTDEFRQRIQERLSRVDEEPASRTPARRSANDETDFDRRKQFEKRAIRSAAGSARRDSGRSFAVVREAGRRVLNMRHFDVQLIGGMVLHEARLPK